MDEPRPVSPPSSPAAGTTIPPEVYDIGFGWDPQPEVERLLWCCHEVGVTPHSALELGCGTGRLLRALQPRLAQIVGLDLSPAMVAYARRRSGVPVHMADMSNFQLHRHFDLVFASANTLRYVWQAQAAARMWTYIARHLRPGGVFVADLELGLAAEAANLDRPATWTISRGHTLVRVTWTVLQPPDVVGRCATIEWAFEVQWGRPRGYWHERFTLRTYDADEFVQAARAGGGLVLRGLYLLRDPYLFPMPPEQAVGRALVVLQRPADDPSDTT